MKKYLPYILIIIISFGLFSPILVANAQTKGICTVTEPKVPTQKIETTSDKCTGPNMSFEEKKDVTTNPAVVKLAPKKVVTKTTVPACTGENGENTNKCCKQNDDSDKGLIRCGRKISCEYLITTDKDGNEKEDLTSIVKTPDKANACDFNAVMDTVNRIINFLLLLSLPIVAIMFAYAGGTLLLSGGNPSARTKAKEIFFAAVIGLVIAFCAYIIIHLILTTLGYEGGWIGF